MGFDKEVVVRKMALSRLLNVSVGQPFLGLNYNENNGAPLLGRRASNRGGAKGTIIFVCGCEGFDTAFSANSISWEARL